MTDYGRIELRVTSFCSLLFALTLAGLAGCSSAPPRDQGTVPARDQAANTVRANKPTPPPSIMLQPPVPGLSDSHAAGSQAQSTNSENGIAIAGLYRSPPITHLGPIADPPPLAKTVDLTAPPDDLWGRIRKGFAMPDLNGPLVLERQAWYTGQEAYLERIIQRSKLYLYHIVDELEERGMPMELALLPMVESAFNPMAHSSAQASGLWQFIPSTGKQYKLQQDWWYDARRDIVASTDAALNYFSFLYEMHGDWQLALASYNWGENAVARAIKNNLAKGISTDYSSLNMPLETRLYVPKLQALKNIVSDPRAFGIDLDAIPNQPYFVSVETEDIDVRVAAKLAEMPVEQLMALNPGHNRPVIYAEHSKTLLLPANRVKKFLANLTARTKPLVSWKSYRFKRGDSLRRLAVSHSISPVQLRKVNSISARTPVRPGMQLLLPIRRATENVQPGARFMKPLGLASAPQQGRRIIYTVKRGNTLTGIAKQHHVSVSNLRQWNKLPHRFLAAGLKLVIYLRGIAGPEKLP